MGFLLFSPVVDSCMHGDIAHLNGEKWYQSTQHECSCNDGVIGCRSVICPLSANEGCINNETGVHAFCRDITCQSEGNHSIYLFFHLFIYLPLCSSINLDIYFYIHHFFMQSDRMLLVHLHIRLSIYLPSCFYLFN